MPSTAPSTDPSAASLIPGPVAASGPPRDRWFFLAGREPYVLAVVLFAAYAAVSIGRYLRMGTRSYDLGIFEQAIRAYAHFQEPVADLKGPGTTSSGTTSARSSRSLAPVYRVFPGPVTLLVVQAALFALSAVPVTRAAGAAAGAGPRARARGGVRAVVGAPAGRGVRLPRDRLRRAPAGLRPGGGARARRWRRGPAVGAAAGARQGGPRLHARRPGRGGGLAGPAHRPAGRLDRRSASRPRPAVFAVLVFTVIIPAFATDGLRLLGQDRRRRPASPASAPSSPPSRGC